MFAYTRACASQGISEHEQVLSWAAEAGPRPATATMVHQMIGKVRTTSGKLFLLTLLYVRVVVECFLCQGAPCLGVSTQGRLLLRPVKPCNYGRQHYECFKSSGPARGVCQ